MKEARDKSKERGWMRMIKEGKVESKGGGRRDDKGKGEWKKQEKKDVGREGGGYDG